VFLKHPSEQEQNNRNNRISSKAETKKKEATVARNTIALRRADVHVSMRRMNREKRNKKKGAANEKKGVNIRGFERQEKRNTLTANK
jgi:Flp pilus assembly protein TadB